jgi:hypothetical protein
MYLTYVFSHIHLFTLNIKEKKKKISERKKKLSVVDDDAHTSMIGCQKDEKEKKTGVVYVRVQAQVTHSCY